jgi:hypothetical protein
MNYLDLTIIYLTLGSPFGTHYFFNQRQQRKFALVKSVLVAIFWIPYATLLLLNKVKSKLNPMGPGQKTKDLSYSQKKLESYLLCENKQISLFEFREILERYTELTLITLSDNDEPSKHEIALYKLNGNKNPNVSALCLHRKNIKKLKLHQGQAQLDFLKTIKMLSVTPNLNTHEFFEDTLDYVSQIKDEKTITALYKIFNSTKQRKNTMSVLNWEKELWTEPKQRNEKLISIQ